MRVALLEKTKTPYRPPLFEYLGEWLDLTVYYVGETPDRRQWSLNADAQNYEVREPESRRFGPFTVVPDLKHRLCSRGYDEIIVSAGSQMLLNSLLGASAATELQAQLTVWSESIDTSWRQGHGRPLLTRLAKIPYIHFINKLQAHLYSCADHVVTYSQLAKEAALSVGACNRKVTVAPQWYPPEILADPDPTNSTDTYKILYIGHLSKHKGVDVLLNVARDWAEIEFAIAGTGPLRGEVATAANQYEHIHELGYIEGKRKSTEFATADLLVLPTRHDAWGLVVNEAYIFNTPAITTTAAGAEMIVPESLTVPPGDSRALTSAIETARRNRPSAPSQPNIEAMANPLL